MTDAVNIAQSSLAVEKSSRPRSAAARRLLPLLLLAAASTLFLFSGGRHYLTFAALAENSEWLRAVVARSSAIAALSFVAAYAGLTARVHQSGGHGYQGSITRQGSPWLRWILVEAAMKAIRKDVALKNFYTRVRKRSSAKIARVATARKLAEICWKRLRRWHAEHASVAA